LSEGALAADLVNRKVDVMVASGGGDNIAAVSAFEFVEPV
jgi:hypothetical protein